MTPSWTDPSPGSVGSPSLTESDRHRLLASERRRLCLQLLVDSWMPVELGALAEALVEREGDRRDDAEAVEIALHHVHLPLMNELGVVDYDASSQRIHECRVSEDLLPR